MKAERRQELKTNELAQMIEDVRRFFRNWGSYVVGGAVVIVVLIAFTVYQAKAGKQELNDAWQTLRDTQRTSFFTQSGEKRTDAEITAGFEGFQDLAAAAQDPDLVFEALAAQAMIALHLSGMGDGGVDSRYLDTAEQACNALKDRLPDNALAVATALNGLVNVQADRFVVDGDASRKEKAREMLETLRDDSRFANTPFQMSALERLNSLDDVFRRRVLAPAPAPEPVPATATRLEGPPVPSRAVLPPAGGGTDSDAPAPAAGEEPADMSPAPEEQKPADVAPAAEDAAGPGDDQESGDE